MSLWMICEDSTYRTELCKRQSAQREFREAKFSQLALFITINYSNKAGERAAA
jgi:hypothetical protein